MNDLETRFNNFVKYNEECRYCGSEMELKIFFDTDQSFWSGISVSKKGIINDDFYLHNKNILLNDIGIYYIYSYCIINAITRSNHFYGYGGDSKLSINSELIVINNISVINHINNNNIISTEISDHRVIETKYGEKFSLPIDIKKYKKGNIQDLQNYLEHSLNKINLLI